MALGAEDRHGSNIAFTLVTLRPVRRWLSHWERAWAAGTAGWLSVRILSIGLLA